MESSALWFQENGKGIPMTRVKIISFYLMEKDMKVAEKLKNSLQLNIRNMAF